MKMTRDETLTQLTALLNGGHYDLIPDLVEEALLPDPHHHVDSNTSGTYIGTQAEFKGQRAILHVHSNGIVYAQFDCGPVWMTHSWLTFPVEDWSITEAVI